MGTPTEKELKHALQCAIDMREQDQDHNFMAKALLNHHYRLKEMQKVVKATKLYLRSGQSTMEHAKMIKALEHYDKIDDISPDIHDFGLD